MRVGLRSAVARRFTLVGEGDPMTEEHGDVCAAHSPEIGCCVDVSVEVTGCTQGR